MTFRFMRPLGDVPSLYAHYESDDLLVENKQAWGHVCENARTRTSTDGRTVPWRADCQRGSSPQRIARTY
jgi:hypothetical protein